MNDLNKQTSWNRFHLSVVLRCTRERCKDFIFTDYLFHSCYIDLFAQKNFCLFSSRNQVLAIDDGIRMDDVYEGSEDGTQ